MWIASSFLLAILCRIRQSRWIALCRRVRVDPVDDALHLCPD